MDLKGVIFDVDGTLGDTLPVCIAACRSAFFVATGRSYRDEEIEATFGPTEDGIVRRVAGDRWKEAWEAFLEEYYRSHEVCGEPFSGMKAALRVLKERGVLLAVVTGKGKTTTGYTLKKWGLIDCFDAIETGSDDGPVKPRLINKVLRRWNVPADSVAYLGDAPTDIDAAREAGLIPLVAAWAESTRVEPLIAMEPEAVFYSVEEFAGWVEASASDQ